MTNLEIIEKAETNLKDAFKNLERISLFNQEKVLNAFKQHKIALNHFSGTTGYGYDDLGRDTLAKVFATVLEAEDAIVSPYISCGTHALTTALFAVLRPGDTMLSISGTPYDTLYDVINGEMGQGSLKEFGVEYKGIDLIGSDFDEDRIIETLKTTSPKLIFIQRSRGYSNRDALTISKISNIISKIRQLNKSAIIMVDNCYGEFTEIKEPTGVGANLMVGSLIKNPGGGLAPTGAYIAGDKNIIKQVGSRLFSPSLGNEVGSFESGYRLFYQGFFLAPHTVLQAMKGAMLIAESLRILKYNAIPAKDTTMSDIICSIEFKTKEELIKFCQTIQANSPVDSHCTPMPWEMPGYEDQVIMAAGAFVQGSSIELSCDSPIKKPYIAYLQGGLTYEHVKIALKNCLNELIK